MPSISELLERESTMVDLEPGDFERLVRRRDRKRRNRRLSAGVVGIAVFVAAVWIVTSVGSLDRSETSVVPGGDVTGPTETGPTETGPAETGPTETGPTVAPDSGWFDGGYPENDLPPEEAVLSTPEEGELVAKYHEWVGTSLHFVFVYADGRVISWTKPVPYLSATLSERRLTPEGVELVRSGAVRPAMFLDDSSDLPEGAWADHVSKPFVPSKYGFCYTMSDGAEYVPGTTVLDFFPARARDILRGKDHTNTDVPCSEVTTDEARTLLHVLGTMATTGNAASPDYPRGVRLEDSDGDPIGWFILMLLPHGAPVPCTGCY